jgi:hypothetical protein
VQFNPLRLFECCHSQARDESNFNDSSRLNRRAFLSNLAAMMVKTFKANESAVGGQ